MDQLILPLLLALLFVPLFLSFRKQRRQYAEMQQLQNSLEAGDRVMTTSGMQATIISTGDDTVDLEIAPGVVTTWVRAAVREKIVPPAATTESDTSDDETVADEAEKR